MCAESTASVAVRVRPVAVALVVRPHDVPDPLERIDQHERHVAGQSWAARHLQPRGGFRAETLAWPKPRAADCERADLVEKVAA